MHSKLIKINKRAAKNIEQSLFKMTSKKISVKIQKTIITKIDNVKTIISNDELVAAIYLSVKGFTPGAVLLVFDKKTACVLSHLILMEKEDVTMKLTKTNKTVLAELGNIMCGNYLTAFSNILKIETIEGIPKFSLGIFGAIIDQVVADFVAKEKTEEVLVVEIKFMFKSEKLVGYFIIMFEADKLEKILNEEGSRVRSKGQGRKRRVRSSAGGTSPRATVIPKFEL